MAWDESQVLWLSDVAAERKPRPRLEGTTPTECDVAIVGGGFTGLWTAYYLARENTGMHIIVIEGDRVGTGASGRNGAQCTSAQMKGNLRTKIPRGARAHQDAIHQTIGEIGDVAREERLDAHYHKGGYLTVALAEAHVARLESELKAKRELGYDDRDYRWMDATECRERVALDSCHGGIFTPHGATVHPARLALGLAEAVEAKGVEIFEHSPATRIDGGRVTTRAGAVVTAPVIVRATECFSRDLAGYKRAVVPLVSYVVATAPLPEAVLDQMHWPNREGLADASRRVAYWCLTGERRVVFGGLRYPYRYGSRFEKDMHGPAADSAYRALERELVRLHPMLAGVPITHRWSGPVSMPRDMWSSVGLDRGTGLAWAGGYSGEGVVHSNLAGRTLRDLILERRSDLTALPWVDHRSRRWEPEPLRWAGMSAALVYFMLHDRRDLGDAR